METTLPYHLVVFTVVVVVSLVLAPKEVLRGEMSVTCGCGYLPATSQVPCL